MEQTNRESRIMAIDYGEKRIGIALTDPLLTFAYPYTTIKNSSSLITDLSNIISEKNILKVILGLPSANYKSSQKISEMVLKLKAQIEAKLKVEVILWDEEFSSIIAKERVIESVTKKSKRKDKGLLDKHAAAIILQEYLDTQ